MARDFSEVLQQAMEFYVAGQLVEARALLLDVVRADSKLEAGWMFLSYTLEEPGQKADCLRKVLALNPENTEAKAALEKLEGILHEGPKAPPSTGELLHASPFTVDIDHATDDISIIPDGPVPGSGSLGQFPPMPGPAQAAPAVPTPALTPEPVSSKPSPTAVSKPIPQPTPDQMGAPPPVRQSASAKPTPVSQPSHSPFIEEPAQPAPHAASQPTVVSGKPVPVPARGKPIPGETDEQEKEKPKKRGNLGWTCFTVLIVLTLIVVGAGVGLWATGNLPADLFPRQDTPTESVVTVITNTPKLLILPPESTKTPTPTITLTPTITPTPTLTLTPTLAPPDATVQADMKRLEKEVEDLRGLEMNEEIPIYVVTLDQAESILQAELDRTGYRDTIQNEAKALAVLGYIKPTYNLAEYALSRLSDGVMGFYMPTDRTIYIIGNRFAGMERWTFTHEYDHALVHHYYPAVGILDDDPICAHDSQRCEAIRALVEGDSMLIMVQWLDQYATAYDERDIAQYPYPFLLPPGQNTPPYVTPSVEFSYYAGLNFVGSLWSLGSWARVNQAYENLPVSTEQILHPQKYLDGEKPVAMKLPKLESALGNTWTLIESDSLGEFMTYLLLAYGADNIAQISTETAKTATEGWGGDHYLVFASTQGDQLILAAEWAWDTTADATDFLAAMKTYLDKRFRGEKLSPAPGDCWTMNQQTACLFHAGKNVLWVVAPDAESIGVVRSAYPIY
jgi:hypothetical protein